MTNVIRSADVADKAISVRLDPEAQRALDSLMASGLTCSEAIRQALVRTARLERLERVEADAKRLGGDPKDRALVAEIAEFFGEVDLPPG
jgi:Arc/MetJ-type ribon-helix-helix transcriptional regulator